MDISTFDRILEHHVRTTLVPQMTNPLNRFMVGAALGAGRLKAETMKDALESLGVMRGGTDVDTDKLAAALRGGFEQTPEVSVFGFRFSRDDAEAFLQELNVQNVQNAQNAQAQPPQPPQG